MIYSTANQKRYGAQKIFLKFFIFFLCVILWVLISFRQLNFSLAYKWNYSERPYSIMSIITYNMIMSSWKFKKWYFTTKKILFHLQLYNSINLEPVRYICLYCTNMRSVLSIFQFPFLTNNARENFSVTRGKFGICELSTFLPLCL